MNLESTSKSKHDKHTLCLWADHQLAIIITKIDMYGDMLHKNSILLLTSKLADLPPSISDKTSIKDNLIELENHLSSVVCYIKLHKTSLNIPRFGENSTKWLKEFRETLEFAKNKFKILSENIILLTITIINAINIDTLHHKEFRKHYTHSLTQALNILSCKLGKSLDTSDSDSEQWTHKWKKMLTQSTVDYYNIPEKIIHKADLMNETELVDRVSRVFKNYLIRSDRAQGAFDNETYKILSILGSLNEYYKRGEYDLSKFF